MFNPVSLFFHKVSLLPLFFISIPAFVLVRLVRLLIEGDALMLFVLLAGVGRAKNCFWWRFMSATKTSSWRIWSKIDFIAAEKRGWATRPNAWRSMTTMETTKKVCNWVDRRHN